MAQKKNNKVSVAAIEKIMKEHFASDTKTFDWYGVEVEYKENISIDDMASLVDEVVNSCFDKDGNYIPEFKDFLIRALIVRMYSNVRMPQDIKKQYSILFNGDLYDVLTQHIDKVQYTSILDAIDTKLLYRSSADIASARQAINEMIAQFQNLSEQLNLADALMYQEEDEEVIIEDKENKIISINGDDVDEDRNR